MLDFNEYDPFDWYWIVDGSGDVYASRRAEYVAIDDTEYAAWMNEDRVPTRIASHADLVDVLRRAGVPPYHRVPTYTIVTRLQAAGLVEIAMAALQSDAVAYARFFTADSRGGIDADAADVRAFLSAIGADPDAILAP